MAPEQRSGGDSRRAAPTSTPAAWSSTRLLTGERPAGTDLPSDLNPKVPKWLDDVFKRSYARLDKRFATAADFMNALSRWRARRRRFRARWRRRCAARAPGCRQLAADRRSPRATTCPHCRQAIAGEDNFCMHCGVQLVSHVRALRQVRRYPDPRDRYCILCGEELDDSGGDVIANAAVVYGGRVTERGSFHGRIHPVHRRSSWGSWPSARLIFGGWFLVMIVRGLGAFLGSRARRRRRQQPHPSAGDCPRPAAAERGGANRPRRRPADAAPTSFARPRMMARHVLPALRTRVGRPAVHPHVQRAAVW